MLVLRSIALLQGMTVRNVLRAYSTLRAANIQISTASRNAPMMATAPFVPTKNRCENYNALSALELVLQYSII